KVDTADLVKAPEGVIGSRALVEVVHEQANNSGQELGALVDREFRGFDLAPAIKDTIAAHKSVGRLLVWTRGHSIENYFFRADAARAFLRYQFSHLTIPEAEFDRLFPLFLQWAAALSLALHASGLLDRAKGVCSPTHWNQQQDPQFDVGTFCNDMLS